MKVCTSMALQAARLSRARKTTQYGGPVSSGGRKHSVPISTFVLNTLTLSSRNMLLHSDKVYRIFSFVMSERPPSGSLYGCLHGVQAVLPNEDW